MAWSSVKAQRQLNLPFTKTVVILTDFSAPSLSHYLTEALMQLIM